MEIVSQIFIGLFGVTAIFLTQDHRHEWRKWASVFGLAASPFWFYTTIYNEQWGITALNFLYLYSWGRGFVNVWIKGEKI